MDHQQELGIRKHMNLLSGRQQRLEKDIVMNDESIRDRQFLPCAIGLSVSGG